MFCGKCGTNNPDTNTFCSNCGKGLIRQQPPGAPATRPPPAPAPVQVCVSCGTRSTTYEKFCGECGTPATPVMTPYLPPQIPVPAQVQGPRFCRTCGTPAGGTAKFCEGCGSPVIASSPAIFPVTPVPTRPPPPPVYAPVRQSNEPVVGIIPGAKERKMLGFSSVTYTIVITNQRMILAQLTEALMVAANNEVMERSKAQGKGFLENAKELFLVRSQFSQRYFSMTPDQIISETPGNRAIDNAQISAIKLKGGQGIINMPTNVPEGEFKMIIDSSHGVFEYFIPEEKRYSSMLKDVYGEKLHMPFGYIPPVKVDINLF